MTGETTTARSLVVASDPKRAVGLQYGLLQLGAAVVAVPAHYDLPHGLA